MTNKKLHRSVEIFSYSILGVVLTIVNIFLLTYSCGFVCFDGFYAPMLFLVTLALIESLVLGFLVKRKLSAILGASPIIVSCIYFIYSVLDQKNYSSLEFDNVRYIKTLLMYFLLASIGNYLGALLGVRIRKLFKN